jgi:glutamate dehydrogenase/leucine dehydrogenase
MSKVKDDPKWLAEQMKQNNPNNEPVGHFTGRCMRCGSRNLWDDAAAYGCDNCDALFMTGHLDPMIIRNQ